MESVKVKVGWEVRLRLGASRSGEALRRDESQRRVAETSRRDELPRRVLTIFLLVCCAHPTASLATARRAYAETSRTLKKKPPERYIETITTKDGQKLSFEMVLIPSGTFLMGSVMSEACRSSDEGPQHEVRLDAFYLCTTETTLKLFLAYYQETISANKEFIAEEQAKKDKEQTGGDKLAPAEAGVDAITGPTPVYGDLTMGYEQTCPAIGMTWHNATTFCKWLSSKTAKLYRLPTEAEWEYACREGTTNIFGFGNDPNRLTDYAWYKENSDQQAHEVAQKKSNALGLYDMLGNVREWVYDFYSSTAYQDTAKKGEAVNPKGPVNGKVHVARGGDYSSSPAELRCAARAFEEQWWRSGDPQIPKSIWWLPEMDFIGLRVARSVDSPN